MWFFCKTVSIPVLKSESNWANKYESEEFFCYVVYDTVSLFQILGVI
jgi:hypothetical protein